MNYSRTIREYCLQNPGMLFDMSYEHKKHFEMVPYRTFCKILSRLEDEGILKPYSKGLYIISSDNIKEDPVIAFYANENTGLVVGYKMYNEFGITEHTEKPIVIYTNAMETTTKNIGDDYKLILFDEMFDDHIKKLIICLELIQNGRNIIDYDLKRIYEVLQDYLQYYDDFSFRTIVKNIRYSLSTIATLDELLSKLHVPNMALEIAKKYYHDA